MTATIATAAVVIATAAVATATITTAVVVTATAVVATAAITTAAIITATATATVLSTFVTGLEDTKHCKERLCKVGLEMRWGAGGWMCATGFSFLCHLSILTEFFCTLSRKTTLKDLDCHIGAH